MRTVEVVLTSLLVGLSGSALPQAASADTYTTTTTIQTPRGPVRRTVTERRFVNRVVERPVVVEKVISRPVVVERVVTKPVVTHRYHTGLIPGVYRLIFGG
jgi:hypothetical protein